MTGEAWDGAFSRFEIEPALRNREMPLGLAVRVEG